MSINLEQIEGMNLQEGNPIEVCYKDSSPELIYFSRIFSKEGAEHATIWCKKKEGDINEVGYLLTDLKSVRALKYK